MGLEYGTLAEGQQLEPMEKEEVTKVQLVKYAGASGDFNPLHTDDEFARSIGMDGVIAHGMLVMGFLGEYMMALAGENAEPVRFNMRFGAVTKPGDQITCRGQIDRMYQEDGNRFAVLGLRAEKSAHEVVGTGSAVLRFQA